MIPFRDDNPTRRFPLVVVALIVGNVAVYLHQWLLPPGEEVLFTCKYGVVPAVLFGQATVADSARYVLSHSAPPALVNAFLADRPLSVAPLQPIWLTLFTSMFLHGGFVHLLSNMLYLWIFGNNIEDLLGHARFVLFYLVCGLLAAGLQVALSVSSPVPMIGASGAIAGVLGAYFAKFPRARVQVLVFLFFFITVVWVPAGLLLLLWFLGQVLDSVGAIGQTARGGVAVFAHIGGFLAGYWIIRRLRPGRPRVIAARHW